MTLAKDCQAIHHFIDLSAAAIRRWWYSFMKWIHFEQYLTITIQIYSQKMLIVIIIIILCTYIIKIMVFFSR